MKTWNVLRYLVRLGHEVHLVSFVRADEIPHMGPLQDLCASVSVVPIRRSRRMDLQAWLKSHKSRRPFLVERDDVQGMTRLVQGMAALMEIEAIHADQLSMAQFALVAKDIIGGAPKLVFDAHNAVWTVVRRMRRQMPIGLWPVVGLEIRRVKAYEAQVVLSFDHTLVVSEADRMALVQAAEETAIGRRAFSLGRSSRDRISVVPIGVDIEKLSPVRRTKGSTNILVLGTLHYPPNADGVRWFARKIFPIVQDQVPSATLTIVGKNPPKDIERLVGGAITVTGYAPDLASYLELAAVMVVPVRAGGGMRVRILEGFARGIPMVTTTVGLEGIEAEVGRDILIADTEQRFASETARLLQNEGLGASLAGNGRRLVVAKYDWRRALESLEAVYVGERNKAPAA